MKPDFLKNSTKISRIVITALTLPSIFVFNKNPLVAMTALKKIYVSHAPIDSKFLEMLLIHLRNLKKLGIIDFWSSEDIEPGKVISVEKSNNLREASIVIAMVSQDYFADDDCIRIQEEANISGKTIIPILINRCLWQIDPILNQLTMYPQREGKPLPVTEWANPSDAFAHTVEYLYEKTSGQKIPGGEISPPSKKEIRKILFLAANPVDTDYLRLDRHVREIDEHLQKGGLRDKFELIPKPAVRVRDLQPYLANIKPDIVEFSGHGAGEHGLVFEDDIGFSKNVKLHGLFKLFSDQVECVILNACFSIEQGKLIKKYIPNVIAMKDDIFDDEAIAFSAGFYLALGAGESYDRAFHYGINRMELEGSSRSWVPELVVVS